MRNAEFSAVVDAMGRMTLRQIQKLAEIAEEASRRVEAIADIERRTGEAPACRHCGLGPVVRWGRGQGGLQRWRCRACSRTFNSAFGTGLARVKKRPVFHRFIENMTQNQPLSCRDAAKAFGIARTTAWRWRMKVCDAIKGCGTERLGGVVEADETFQRESRKASREWANHQKNPAVHPRPPRLRWVDHARHDLPMKRGLSRWQVPIMTIMDRSGGRRADMLRGLSYASIGPVLEKHIEPDAALCSDKAQAYKKFVAKTGMRHIRVRARKGERVKDKTFHIQNVNSLHSRYGKFIEPFRGPATRNLPGYIAWFVFRDLFSKDETRAARLWGEVLTAG